MMTPRKSLIGTIVAFLILLVLDRLAKPILDVEVQDFWKDNAHPVIRDRAWPWVNAMLDWLGPYWSGAFSALIILTFFEITISSWRNRRPKQAIKTKRHVFDEYYPKNLFDCYLHDFDEGRGTLRLVAQAGTVMRFSDGRRFEILYSVIFEFSSLSKYVLVYMRRHPDGVELLKLFADDLSNLIVDADPLASMSGLGQVEIISRNLTFTGHVVIYQEQELTNSQLSEIEKYFNDKKMIVSFRGENYFANVLKSVDMVKTEKTNHNPYA